MPKRYYCDYCSKSFQDTPRNRKRHLAGLTHQRMKKQHYESIVPEFKQPAASILYSGMSGEEILQQWIAKHPEVQRRYENSRANSKR